MDFYAEPAFFVIALPVVVVAAVLGMLERPLGRYGFVEIGRAHV